MNLKLPEPVACLVETERSVLVWPIADFNEAITYCDDDESPEKLYTEAQLKQALRDVLEEAELALEKMSINCLSLQKVENSDNLADVFLRHHAVAHRSGKEAIRTMIGEIN